MKKQKSHCNDCGKETNHDKIHEHVENWGNDDISGRDVYSIIKCCGCDSVSFLKISTCSEMWPWDDPEFVYYPHRFSRPLPDWIDRIEEGALERVMKETYNAAFSDSRYLAAFGIRTCLDIVLNKTVGDVGGFEKKIKELVRQKIITTDEEKIFDAIAEAGSAAAHRGHCPNSKTINKLLEMIEVIIYRTIIEPRDIQNLTVDAGEIMQSTPRRHKASAQQVDSAEAATND